jgi:hypothetical protein
MPETRPNQTLMVEWTGSLEQHGVKRVAIIAPAEVKSALRV